MSSDGQGYRWATRQVLHVDCPSKQCQCDSNRTRSTDLPVLERSNRRHTKALGRFGLGELLALAPELQFAGELVRLPLRDTLSHGLTMETGGYAVNVVPPVKESACPSCRLRYEATPVVSVLAPEVDDLPLSLLPLGSGVCNLWSRAGTRLEVRGEPRFPAALVQVGEPDSAANSPFPVGGGRRCGEMDPAGRREGLEVGGSVQVREPGRSPGVAHPTFGFQMSIPDGLGHGRAPAGPSSVLEEDGPAMTAIHYSRAAGHWKRVAEVWLDAADGGDAEVDDDLPFGPAR